MRKNPGIKGALATDPSNVPCRSSTHLQHHPSKIYTGTRLIRGKAAHGQDVDHWRARPRQVVYFVFSSTAEAKQPVEVAAAGEPLVGVAATLQGSGLLESRILIADRERLVGVSDADFDRRREVACWSSEF